MSIATVHVPLGARAYDVRIGEGLLAQAGAEIAPLLNRPRVFVVTEERVAALHLDALRAGLAADGIGMEALILPPGETTKGWPHFTRTVEWLLAEKAERKDIVVAFGGGVIGDLVGFAAAVLRRGVRFVQIPTSLLAQVDSSVGGKTGHQLGRRQEPGRRVPPAVAGAGRYRGAGHADARDFLAGYGEVQKYGLLGDAGFFGWLEANGPAMAAGDAGCGPRRCAGRCR